ncbi:hypothetical protein FVEN_g2314 [Fusarium venenatum]|nr:hypothetical protein FVEN_g2314 [Fusarium venenatum]
MKCAIPRITTGQDSALAKSSASPTALHGTEDDVYESENDEDNNDDIPYQATIKSAVGKKTKSRRELEPITLEPIFIDRVHLVHIDPKPLPIYYQVINVIPSKTSAIYR